MDTIAPDSPRLAGQVAPSQVDRLAELILLGVSEDAADRLRAASDPACPAYSLRSLIADDDPSVRLAAAVHPALPRASMNELAHYADHETATALAANPSVDTAALLVLGQHGAPVVRLAVARHGRTPADHLAALEGDRNELVSAAARRSRHHRAPSHRR